MTLTDSYLKINKTVEKAEKFFAVLIISSIVLIVFAGTIARYIFEASFYWAEPVATYLMVWLGFIGFQIATSKLRHIEIEFLKARVNEKTKYKMNIATSLIASVFLFLFFYLSYQYVMASKEMGDLVKAFEFPMWIVLLILPISFFLSAVRFAFASLLWLDVLKGKRKESDIVVKQLL